MASPFRVSVMRQWIGTVFSDCRPDDRLYVAMLTAWVVLVAVVTYLLLGWAAAGIIILTALFGFAALALQSRQHDRQHYGGSRKTLARDR